jgi:hypothetical protein
MSRWLIDPVRSSSRSASVDLPWSMWAMMQKFRTKACLVVTATSQNARDVNALLVIGALISAAGVVLLVNLVGVGDYVIAHLTSRPLGSLPPGYAASKHGFQVYGLVVLAIGLVFLGVGLAASAVVSGLALLGVGLAAFAFSSVLAIRGEIGTARGKRS